MQLDRNADLAPHTTFGVPARAELLARFTSAQQLRDLLAMPDVKGKPLLVLGGGSNVLFTRDYPGLVLLNQVPGMEVLDENDDHVVLRAGAGVDWHALVLHTVAQGWGGLENLSLIPGKVGAAPMQNIGAYGVELKETFVELVAFRIADGEEVRFDAKACAFGYRESFFKREGRDRFVILSVTFRLRKHPEVNTGYGAIKEQLKAMGVVEPTVKDVSDAVIAIRRSKLPDPRVLGNAGSFFKNPVVPMAEYERIRRDHPDVVGYPAGSDGMKLAAGWLIETAGWKGLRENGEGVHKHQALVLVNHGGATGSGIHALSGRIIADIKQKFGVELEREVNVI